MPHEMPQSGQGFNLFARYRHLCELIRGLQNLGTPCKGDEMLLFAACKK